MSAPDKIDTNIRFGIGRRGQVYHSGDQYHYGAQAVGDQCYTEWGRPVADLHRQDTVCLNLIYEQAAGDGVQPGNGEGQLEGSPGIIFNQNSRCTTY